jgi:hypothetical protein
MELSQSLPEGIAFRLARKDSAIIWLSRVPALAQPEIVLATDDSGAFTMGVPISR